MESVMNRLRNAVTGVGFLVLGSLALAGPALADTVIVEVDRATVLRLDGPASTIILGNPSIADALVQDRSMVVVTGKSFGSTNLIVLDEDGRTIEEKTLQVRAAEDNVVTVQRGTFRTSLSCAPNCERTLAVGDRSEDYDLLSTQIQGRIGLSQGQAEPR
jgi:Flp pilus assembly secretin CpaC